MAWPYLAVTLDAKRRIARAALAIGADPAVWTLGYLNLMEHVWERKDARVSALVIAACFGPDPRAPAALVEFGILMVAGEVWDLNPDDTDRLLLTYKQRVAAGKARAESAARDEKGRVQRSTSGQPAEHQRPASGAPAASQLLHPAPSTQQKEEDLPRAPPAGPRVKKDTIRKNDADPRTSGDATHRAIVDACFVIFLDDRGEDYDPTGKDWAALKRLRATHEGSELIKRFGNGVRAKYKARCSGWWDVEQKWNDLTAPEASGAKAVKAAGATSGGEVVEFPEWPEVRDG